MDEARGSDISKTQMDLIDISETEPVVSGHLSGDDDSLHPTNSNKGFCVKDYEERMNLLKKENFNLKLRVYFLEEKSPSIPLGAEGLYKQNIDLKVQNEELTKDVQERSDLLCKASRALELLEEQKSAELQHAEMMVDEMSQRIESLEHEVSSLQNALADANKPSLSNDTGYAEFLGAVNSNDLELQRKLQEGDELNEKLQHAINEMEEKLRKLQREKKDIDTNTSNLLYENDELKEKVAKVEKKLVEQEKIKEELREFKEKWAATQCDLQDTQDKLNESERERKKTLSILEKTLEALKKEQLKDQEMQENREKKHEYKNVSVGATAENELLAIKNKEISDLTLELDEAKRCIQKLNTQELDVKNREIEKLSSLLGSIQINRDSMFGGSECHRMSLEQLSSSFNDLKFHQASEEKKISQQKIDELMSGISDVANLKTKEHVMQLQAQISIFNQKQEVTDKAFEKCVELCAASLEHLQDLAKFLSALIQQKEIRESLSEMTMFNIQSTLNKTFELSNQVGRSSWIDGRLSCLPDISSLDILMTSARNSLLNVRDIQRNNKSIQAENDEGSAALQAEMERAADLLAELNVAKKELEEFKTVNEVLEDEMYQLKELVNEYRFKISKRDDTIASLKYEAETIEIKFKEVQAKVETLNLKRNDLEEKLQAETVKKLGSEQRAKKSEDLAAELQKKFDEIRKDLEINWVTKAKHDEVVQRLEGEVVNGEAQVAAVRLQMESLQANLNEMKLGGAIQPLELTDSALLEAKDEKEHMASQPMRKTLQISKDRKQLLTADIDSAVSSSFDVKCEMCPQYQSKIIELKKYLSRAMDKIEKQSETEKLNNRQILRELNNTKSFLNTASSKMENIVKCREKE